MTGAPPFHRAHHGRNLSSNTIQFSPLPIPGDQTQISSSPSRTGGNARPTTAIHSGTATPRRTPRPPRPIPVHANSLINFPPPAPSSSRPRPITRGKLVTNHSSPNMAPFFLAHSRGRRNPSFNAMALDLASDLGDNRPRGDGDALGGSFGTQLEMAAMRARRRKEEEEEEEEEERGRVNRIMLARMNTLEEGFREVIKEVRGLKGPVASEGVKKGRSAKVGRKSPKGGMTPKGVATPKTAGSSRRGAGSSSGDDGMGLDRAIEEIGTSRSSV